jgi:tetratricopeptide (TPR) repeat protein
MDVPDQTPIHPRWTGLPVFLAGVLLAIGVLTGCSGLRAPAEPDVATITARAEALLGAGDVEGSLAIFEDALERHPGSLQLGNAYRLHVRRHHQEDRAISFLRVLVEGLGEVGDDGEVVLTDVPEGGLYNLAFAYIDKIPRVGPMGAGFLSKRSIANFRTVLDRDPDNWIANYGVGMNYLHWPDYFKKNDSAVGYFEKLVELQEHEPARPYHLLSYLRLGDAYVRNEAVDRAYEVWNLGLEKFPGHGDLVARLETPRDEILDTINRFYNPNNSIGAIDTDVAVLWATEVPNLAVPLERKEAPGGGGQLTTASSTLTESDIGLFSWFLRNLPFLADSRFHSRVDMSVLGVDAGSQARLANEIAHGMILGFNSVMNDDEPEQIRHTTLDMRGFLRPFYHEGLGMGLAASLDTADPRAFAGFLDRIGEIDPSYARLHLAGAGMWFGLESARSVDSVRQAFEWLGAFGAAYGYEGFGFAVALFQLNHNSEALQVGLELPPLAAQSFYHGAGRAFWILGGDDPRLLAERLEKVPPTYRGDASSGFGMGVAFTRLEEPGTVVSFLDDTNPLTLDQYATGVVMGLTIRHIADGGFVEAAAAEAESRGQCWIDDAVAVGLEALESVQGNSGDYHANWRSQILKAMNGNHLTLFTSGRCS